MSEKEKKMTADEAAKFYRAKLLELKYQEKQEKLKAKPDEPEKESEKPEFATSFLKLASILGVARTTLYALKEKANAPKRADGLFDIEEWRAFVESEIGTTDEDDDHDEEFKKLKREYLRIRTEKERFDLMKKRGNLLTMTEHLTEVREILDQAKWLADAIATRVALLTTDSGVRDSVRSLCAHVEGEFASRLLAAEEKAVKAEEEAKKIFGNMEMDVEVVE